MTWKRLAGALMVGALLLPIAVRAQSPANCNANLLDESISAVPTTAGAGDIVNYVVIVTDRSLIPPGCTPGDPTCQVGCDVLDVTADFCCPTRSATLRSRRPTRSARISPRWWTSQRMTPLRSSARSPARCRNIVGGATAAVVGSGVLADGFNSPFDIFKTIAVAITTTTTTTTTTTSTTTTTTSTTTTTTSTTTTTTLPPLCLCRTPGFWGNHPFLIQSNDPRSLDLLPLTVCGTALNSVAAGDTDSTTEAICSVGTDHKILGRS